MKSHIFIAVIVAVIVGYIGGMKFPQLGHKVGL